jgi:hypothetical protein
MLFLAYAFFSEWVFTIARAFVLPTIAVVTPSFKGVQKKRLPMKRLKKLKKQALYW